MNYLLRNKVEYFSIKQFFYIDNVLSHIHRHTNMYTHAYKSKTSDSSEFVEKDPVSINSHKLIVLIMIEGQS